MQESHTLIQVKKVRESHADCDSLTKLVNAILHVVLHVEVEKLKHLKRISNPTVEPPTPSEHGGLRLSDARGSEVKLDSMVNSYSINNNRLSVVNSAGFTTADGSEVSEGWCSKIDRIEKIFMLVSVTLLAVIIVDAAIQAIFGNSLMGHQHWVWIRAIGVFLSLAVWYQCYLLD